MFDFNDIKLKIEHGKNIFTRKEVIRPILKNIMLCDQVYTDEFGRNHYEAEFRTIYVDALPEVKAEFCLVTKWGDGQGQRFKQEVKIVDPASSLEIFNSVGLENEFNLENIYHEHIIVGHIFDLFLPMEGRFRIEIYMDGELQGKTYFNVVHCPPKQNT